LQTKSCQSSISKNFVPLLVLFTQPEANGLLLLVFVLKAWQQSNHQQQYELYN
jgi:hypothetical protein